MKQAYTYSIGVMAYFVMAVTAFASTDAQPTRLRITNHCTQPIWIQQNYKQTTGKGKPTINGTVGAPGYQSDPLVVSIPVNGFYDYNIPEAGLAGTRFWPKQGCDSSGYHCKLGESTWNPQTPANLTDFAPPIDTKFEATWGCATGIFQNNPSACTMNPSANANGQHYPLDNTTWWNGSLVDGYTLPFIVQVKSDNGRCINAINGNKLQNPSVDCSGLDLKQCPTTENLTTPGQPTSVNGISLSSVNLAFVVDGQIEGCFSPCAKLTYAQGTPGDATAAPPKGWNAANPWPPGGLSQILGKIKPESPLASGYCCPTTAPECEAVGLAANSQFTQSAHGAQKCSAYTYAYDDGIGLTQCPAETQFEVIFCPTSADKPSSTTLNTKATVSLPSDTTVTVLLDGQPVKNNQEVIVYTGSTFSLKGGSSASCVLAVDANKAIALQTGALCAYISIKGSTITFNNLPTSLGFNFQVTLPSGSSVSPIVAYVNTTKIDNATPLSSGLFTSPIVLSANQQDNWSNCTLTITDSSFNKGSENFCQMIVVHTIPGASGGNVVQIDLPAAIPGGGVAPTLPDNGGVTPSPGPTPTPTPEPTPTPTPEPTPAPIPEPVPTGTEYVIFGMDASEHGEFLSQVVNNGTKVAVDSVTNSDHLKLVLHQDNHVVTCMLGWKGNDLTIIQTAAALCPQGIVIQAQGKGEFYVGVPNPLPAQSIAPDPASTPESTPTPTPEPTPAHGSFNVGLASGQTLKVGAETILWNNANKSFSLPAGPSTLSITGANGLTRHCVVTNTKGQLTWDTVSPDCLGVVFNGNTLYFPAF